MIEMPEKVVGGLKIILSMFPKAKGIIAIEDNKPKAIKVLRELADKESNIQVREIKTKFPQGGKDKLFIQLLVVRLILLYACRGWMFSKQCIYSYCYL